MLFIYAYILLYEENWICKLHEKTQTYKDHIIHDHNTTWTLELETILLLKFSYSRSISVNFGTIKYLIILIFWRFDVLTFCDETFFLMDLLIFCNEPAQLLAITAMRHSSHKSHKKYLSQATSLCSVTCKGLDFSVFSCKSYILYTGREYR